MVLFSIFVYADTQRFIDYEYDGAGNIISAQSSRNLGPPDVTNLSPAFVNKEAFAFITATGINLAKAIVQVNTPGIALLEVTNISETELRFTLFADETAQIGAAPVTFTTRLGSDIENVAVAERTPVVSTDPNPIILSPDSQSVLVRLTFDRPLITDQTYDIKVTNEAIANVSEQQVTLLAGETEVSVNVTGLLAGTTTLEINQLSNFLALGIPVIVNDESLPAGNYTQYTDPVGVVVFVDQPINSNGPFITSPVGVATFVEQPLNTNGPFITRPVGVATFIEQSTNTNGPFVTSPVGVAIFIDQSINTNGPFVTAIVGNTLGTAADQITPQSISLSTNADLIVDGIELDLVTAISFSPSDGITQTSAFTVSPDGTQMTIPVSVSTTASTGNRTIIFSTPTGNETYSNTVFEITN